MTIVSDELKVDPERIAKYGDKGTLTGIYVRAKMPSGKWVSADIMVLEKDSLLSWLRSRGGENPWAENTVGIILGYGTLIDGGPVFVVESEQ